MFFLDAEQKSGLSVPPHELVTDAEGKPGLLIRRFDGLTVDGAVRLLAVQDGCQVLDRPPAAKYLLGAGRTFAALAAVCDAAILAGRDLIRQLAFAYIAGNGDTTMAFVDRVAAAATISGHPTSASSGSDCRCRERVCDGSCPS